MKWNTKETPGSSERRRRPATFLIGVPSLLVPGRGQTTTTQRSLTWRSTKGRPENVGYWSLLHMLACQMAGDPPGNLGKTLPRFLKLVCVAAHFQALVYVSPFLVMPPTTADVKRFFPLKFGLVRGGTVQRIEAHNVTSQPRRTRCNHTNGRISSSHYPPLFALCVHLISQHSFIASTRHWIRTRS